MGLSSIKINNNQVVSINNDLSEDKEMSNNSGILFRTWGLGKYYTPGKDPIFNCGNYDFNEEETYEEVLQRANNDLDSLHYQGTESTEEDDKKYRCHANDENFKGKLRYIPIGICQISIFDSHIWFINNVISFENDEWTQIFFNVDVTDNGYLFGGKNVAIRYYNNGQWTPFNIIPFDINDSIKDKADKTKEITTSEPTVNMKPNILYKLGNRASLTVNFVDDIDDEVNEYMFEFTSVTNDFVLNMPEGVRFATDLDISEGYTYQVSVINDLALIAGWENNNE